tara:strand:- start:65 stop:541 length:477 start_codon:yes stop_codon:yes gene_type:complete
MGYQLTLNYGQTEEFANFVFESEGNIADDTTLYVTDDGDKLEDWACEALILMKPSEVAFLLLPHISFPSIEGVEQVLRTYEAYNVEEVQLKGLQLSMNKFASLVIGHLSQNNREALIKALQFLVIEPAMRFGAVELAYDVDLNELYNPKDLGGFSDEY